MERDAKYHKKKNILCIAQDDNWHCSNILLSMHSLYDWEK